MYIMRRRRSRKVFLFYKLQFLLRLLFHFFLVVFINMVLRGLSALLIILGDLDARAIGLIVAFFGRRGDKNWDFC